MTEELTPEIQDKLNQHIVDNYIKLLEEDQKLDVSDVENDKVEIVVSKAFGGSERLEVKITTTFNKAHSAVVAAYRNVVNPRALSYAKETIDYQLEADRMAREIKKREQEEEDALNASRKKKGKR